ncbi:uncharacterized protein LOC144994226 isoform X1 [Oryzias latipes]
MLHSASVLQTSGLASTSQSHITPVELPPSDSPVEFEGWVRLWEDPNSILPADVNWLKGDTERGLFTAVQIFKDVFWPSEKESRVFVWRPVGVWRYSLKCPRGVTCAGAGRDVHLYKSGYHHRVRHICDVSSWYTMLTEVLCCGPCTKATRNKEGGTVGRWLAWDHVILSQLSEAHPAMFPAVLTCKRGVDKNVVRLLWDRTEGNTTVKVWRQVQENPHEEYLHRKDLYTTLLMSTVEPRGIVSSLGHTFRPPPPPPSRELASTRLLRHAFLLAEADNVQHYRNQILSTFGTVLKMDSTKKVVKKLSGEAHGSAEWFTSVGNEHSQIVTFVLTCEEFTDKLWPTFQGLRGFSGPINRLRRSCTLIGGVAALKAQQQWRLCSSLGLTVGWWFVWTSSTGCTSSTQPSRPTATPNALRSSTGWGSSGLQ